MGLGGLASNLGFGIGTLSIFMNVIYGVSLRGIGEDKMCSTPIKSRGSDVSNYYQALLGVSI